MKAQVRGRVEMAWLSWPVSLPGWHHRPAITTYLAFSKDFGQPWAACSQPARLMAAGAPGSAVFLAQVTPQGFLPAEEPTFPAF